MKNTVDVHLCVAKMGVGGEITFNRIMESELIKAGERGALIDRNA